MSWWNRVDTYQREHRWAGFPLGVVYKFGDDQGNYLAALITYYAFVSLFPLLLLGSSILGFVLQGNPELQRQILDSTLARFPVIGTDLQQPGGLKGSGVAVAVGAIVSLYGALGVANATQNALNIAWAVPRNRRPNPIMARIRSVILLSVAGLAILATTFIANVAAGVSALGGVEPGMRLLITAGTVVVNAAIFTVLFWMAAAHDHRIRQDIPGGLFVALVWQTLQLFGSAYVSRVIQDSDATSGTFAIVLGMIAWIYVGAVAVTFGIEVNVVHAKHLYPRALLTPFTDNVDLTDADRAVYTGYAQAQGHKGFQSVDVSFDEPVRPGHDHLDSPRVPKRRPENEQVPDKRDAVS